MDMLWLCEEESCTKTHKKNRFANSQAQSAGWFFQKDGTAWCPDHVPSWVEEWRAKNAAK